MFLELQTLMIFKLGRKLLFLGVKALDGCRRHGIGDGHTLFLAPFELRPQHIRLISRSLPWHRPHHVTLSQRIGALFFSDATAEHNCNDLEADTGGRVLFRYSSLADC